MDALGNLVVAFSSEIDYERMVNLNKSCFDFVVIPNREYHRILKEWKENDPNVVIRKRNLGVYNSTLADVRGNIVSLKINFNHTTDISKGGTKHPDMLKMRIH